MEIQVGKFYRGAHCDKCEVVREFTRKEAGSDKRFLVVAHYDSHLDSFFTTVSGGGDYQGCIDAQLIASELKH